jgi:ectoine hydroxylase
MRLNIGMTMTEIDPSAIVAPVGDEELRVLSRSQRDAYADDGYIVVEDLVPDVWLDELRAVTAAFVDKSRSLTKSDKEFDLEPDHCAEAPRIRRLNFPVDRHEAYWRFATESPVIDAVMDLLGPNIKFHHGKLNFKAPKGGEEVKWHQDIQFWPHTNYGPLTVGVFLDDVSEDMGNVGFVPGSHQGELYPQYHGDRWMGCLTDEDVAKADIETAVYPTGPAGTVTIHNCRMVHGSAPNRSDTMRPLLLQTYSPTDAFAYTSLVSGSPHGDVLIRGEPARWARHDPRPCEVGPTRGKTIFEVQQGE